MCILPARLRCMRFESKRTKCSGLKASSVVGPSQLASRNAHSLKRCTADTPLNSGASPMKRQTREDSEPSQSQPDSKRSRDDSGRAASQAMGGWTAHLSANLRLGNMHDLMYTTQAMLEEQRRLGQQQHACGVAPESLKIHEGSIKKVLSCRALLTPT